MSLSYRTFYNLNLFCRSDVQLHANVCTYAKPTRTNQYAVPRFMNSNSQVIYISLPLRILFAPCDTKGWHTISLDPVMGAPVSHVNPTKVFSNFFLQCSSLCCFWSASFSISFWRPGQRVIYWQIAFHPEVMVKAHLHLFQNEAGVLLFPGLVESVIGDGLELVHLQLP